MSALVMVIEDEKEIRDLVRYNLEREGYRVAAADDGEKGLSQIFASRPDLLAAAIVDLAADADRRTELARRAVERAGAFDIANAAVHLERRYEALAAGRRARP